MPHSCRQIVLLDDYSGDSPEFLAALTQLRQVEVCSYHNLHMHVGAGSILLVDARTALDLAEHEAELVFRGPYPRIAIVSDIDIDGYLPLCSKWGIGQTFIKVPPVSGDDLSHFLDCIEDPSNGFGLYRYLTSTMEMYSQSIATIAEKNQAVEKVINHFATAGFEIHGLFDVRLVLEEALNNALYHAFRLPNGVEKYAVSTFGGLGQQERIRLEYGNCGELCGLTVTDNAGTLSPSRVLRKLERQTSKDAAFDTGGRGLHLSRMLSTNFVINIEEAKRTQIVAIFDDRRSIQRPRPLMVNYLGTEDFSLWRPESDMD